MDPLRRATADSYITPHMPPAVREPLVNDEGTAARSHFRLELSLLALFLFVTLICLALAWLVQPKRVVVTALFEVGRSSRELMGGAPYDEREFEVFKATQRAKLGSFYVLQAALRNPGLASLPVFQGKRDPVAWLQEHLEVEFPGESELLAIRLRGPASHANDLIRIVDEVATAYENEVVFADAQTRLNTRDLKAASFKKLEEELAEKMQLIVDMKTELGSEAGDSVEIKLRQLEIDTLLEIVREIRRSLEWNDIEASAPPRIKKIQPAVPSWDD
jgi:hypothetical protein